MFTVKTMLALAAAASLSSLVQAAPMQPQRRIVGSLECTSAVTGRLSLTNQKTGQKLFATFDNDYTLKDQQAGQTIPKDAKYWENDPLLSAFSEIKPLEPNFEFLACKETHPSNGFENFPRSKNGVYYGHLSPTSSTPSSGNPTKCVTHRSLYADEAFLTSEDCYYSDDSGSVASYFSFTPAKDGQINFLGYTGPKGGEPETAEQKKAQYDFTPSTDILHPAVTVHDGSPNFSDWVLRLE